jgi:copper(I)-binding protein
MEMTMRKQDGILIAFIVCLSLIAAQCGPSPAEEAVAAAGVSEITVTDAYLHASMPNGAVYLNLKNNGNAGDRLVGAETDIAEAAELHETRLDENDVMRMRPLEEVELPAGGSATLQPGGMHIMLLGLKQSLVRGDKIKLTLNFAQAEPQTIEVEVREGIRLGQATSGDHAVEHMPEDTAGHSHND